MPLIFVQSILLHHLRTGDTPEYFVRGTDLPIYNIGGDQDPVGEYGKGIYEVTNWLVDTGHTVKTRVYSGYRHEIHNYDEIKDEVEAGIISFMDSILDE